MTCASSSRAMPPRSRSAPTRSPPRSRRRPHGAGIAVEIVRNGSRGLFWLEPLVEVETPEGRIATARSTPGRADAARRDFRAAARIRCGSVAPEEIPFLERQTRLTFARCGIIDPRSLDDYRAHGGLQGPGARAARSAPAAIVEEVTEFGPARPRRRRLPDRHQVADRRRSAEAAQKYIVCNADEGDSGTFADRMIMEGDPFLLIEGMAIAGIAVGATKGYVYIRSEYPHADRGDERGDRDARERGCSARRRWARPRFDMEVRVGAGAYVCGEETSLLESLEGKRGQVRAKPPLPAHRGPVRPADRHQQRAVARRGARSSWPRAPRPMRDFGMGRSRGTMPIQLAGNIKHGGLFETAFGITLGELVDDIGGGTVSGRPVRAVQVGGPLGAYFPRALFDTPFDYEAFAAARRADRPWRHRGVRRHGRHGAAGALRDGVLRHRKLRQVHALPHRLDARRRGDRPHHRRRGRRAANLALLEDLCETMKFGSLCALGGFTPYPVMSALHAFPRGFRPAPPRWQPLNRRRCP